MNGSERLSRREFLIGGGGFAVGAAVGSLLGGGLFSLTPAKAAEPDAPAWPWPYQTLDPEKGRRLGYELYYQGG